MRYPQLGLMHFIHKGGVFPFLEVTIWVTIINSHYICSCVMHLPSYTQGTTLRCSWGSCENISHWPSHPDCEFGSICDRSGSSAMILYMCVNWVLTLAPAAQDSPICFKKPMVDSRMDWDVIYLSAAASSRNFVITAVCKAMLSLSTEGDASWCLSLSIMNSLCSHLDCTIILSSTALVADMFCSACCLASLQMIAQQQSSVWKDKQHNSNHTSLIYAGNQPIPYLSCLCSHICCFCLHSIFLHQSNPCVTPSDDRLQLHMESVSYFNVNSVNTVSGTRETSLGESNWRLNLVFRCQIC